MSDKTEQFDNTNSQKVSDDAIRRFLFGRLSVAEQTRFEECLFRDDRLEARVRLAEFDLVDDYAFARLNAADREAFEEKFLLSAERKRKLEVSTALRDRFASASTVATKARDRAKASIGERLRLLFGLNQRAWRFAFGIAALAVLVGAAWLMIREVRIRRAIDQPPIVRSSPSPSSKREAEHSGSSSPPEHQTTPSPMPPHATAALPAVVSIDLFPGGDKLPHINLPKGEHDIARLQLALRPNQTGSYRAELLTVDDRTIFSSESLQSTDTDAGKIVFDVPAALLKTGGYRVSLSRADDGAKRTIANYYFRVR